VPGVPQDNFPRINITGFSSIGNDRSRPALTRVTAYQLVDNLTWIQGRHYLKFGVDIRRSYSNNASGEFSFGPLQTGISASAQTGNPFASFLLGQGSSFQLLPGVSTYLSFPSNGFYIQDDFKVTSRPTVNLGVRYEPSFHFVKNTIALLISIPSAASWNFAGQNGNPRHFYRNDWNNLGPRFGLAYRATNATILGMSYGMYFASAQSPLTPGPARSSFSICPKLRAYGAGVPESAALHPVLLSRRRVRF
jgi:hypothetical protein